MEILTVRFLAFPEVIESIRQLTGDQKCDGVITVHCITAHRMITFSAEEREKVLRNAVLQITTQEINKAERHHSVCCSLRQAV
jgi:hypothetical protein